MTNELKYTKEVVEEYQRAYWSRALRMPQAISWALLGLGIFWLVWNLVVDDVISVAGLTAVVGGIFLLILIRWKVKKAIQMELDRLEVLCSDQVPVSTVELGDEIVITSSKGGQRKVHYRDIVALRQTEHLLVLLFRGNMTLPLAKDGFSGGDWQDCERLIQARRGQSPKTK